MLVRRLVAAACLYSLSIVAWGAVTASEYRQRRQKLRQLTGPAVTVLFGATEKERGDLRSTFRQESNFYYLTGWTEPGAILILIPNEDILLVPKRDAEEEKWTGPKLAPGDPKIRSLTGCDKVLPAEDFEARLPEWLAAARRVYSLRPQEDARLARFVPTREIRDAAPLLAKLRMVKSEAEIELIRKATEITMEAHRGAWKRIRPGVYEYQVAAAMSNAYFDKGCERHAYPPIVGSGPNATILHYNRNTRKMDAGELVLMDVGAECSMYASDITRTVPVSGKFTPRQRELYEIVLGAQKAALAAARPGVMLRTGPGSLHEIALQYLNTHGKDKHGQPLGKYFTHGLGHHVGLDVHDATDPLLPLEPGMVITLEPGLYIPEENIGIRIEDMVLITKDGARLLSAGLPREADEIESAMAQ